jgi:hypothetical protein
MPRIKTTLPALSLLLCVLGCALVTGCGQDRFTANTETNGTGNWYISGYYATSNNAYFDAPYSFGGSLLNTSGNLTGVFHIDTSCFGNGATDIPYTGTIDIHNNLSITSEPVEGQVLTLQGKLSADNSTLSNGFFSIIGGCSGSILSVPTIDLSGFYLRTIALRVPSLTGSWETPGTGTILPIGLFLTERFTQSSTPDAHGDYALSGTVTAQGSPCFTHGTIQPGSFLSGNQGDEKILMDDGSTLNVPLALIYSQNGPNDQGTLSFFDLGPGTITGGNCNGPFSASLQQVTG